MDEQLTTIEAMLERILAALKNINGKLSGGDE